MNNLQIIQMVRGYQTRGHEAAKIDPLGLPKKPPFISHSRKDPPKVCVHSFVYSFTYSLIYSFIY
jgi:hypothetical protein